MFVATRHNHAASYGHWEMDHREWCSLADAREVLCHSMYECDEHCRGVEIKRVAHPSKKWLAEQIAQCLRASAGYAAKAARLRKILDKRSQPR